MSWMIEFQSIPSEMRAIFLLMADIMASEQRAYMSAPVSWGGHRSTMSWRLTLGSILNLDTEPQHTPSKLVPKNITASGRTNLLGKLVIYTETYISMKMTQLLSLWDKPKYNNIWTIADTHSHFHIHKRFASDQTAPFRNDLLLICILKGPTYFLTIAFRTWSWESLSSLIPT